MMCEAQPNNELVARILADAPGADFKLESLKCTGEKSLVMYVRGMIKSDEGKAVFGQLPFTDADTVINEMTLKVGRADFVIFHMDGSASVVEVKDGINGLMAVLQGVGQAGLYATQLSMTKSLTTVRRALMWSPLRNEQENQLVHDVCREAGVVPLYMPSVADMHAQDVIWAANQLSELLKAVKEHVASE